MSGFDNITSKKVLTLVIIYDKDEDKVLLGYKKRGFGAGLYNGFGGKIEGNETIRQGALRELEEEAGITVADSEFIKCGILWFRFLNDPQALEVHLFKAHSYLGTVQETEEMRPEWFSTKDIPYDQMWEDDRLWIPMLLKGQDPIFGDITLKPRAISADQPASTLTADIASATGQGFALFESRIQHSIKEGAPKEIGLDGKILSYE